MQVLFITLLVIFYLVGFVLTYALLIMSQYVVYSKDNSMMSNLTNQDRMERAFNNTVRNPWAFVCTLMSWVFILLVVIISIVKTCIKRLRRCLVNSADNFKVS